MPFTISAEVRGNIEFGVGSCDITATSGKSLVMMLCCYHNTGLPAMTVTSATATGSQTWTPIGTLQTRTMGSAEVYAQLFYIQNNNTTGTVTTNIELNNQGSSSAGSIWVAEIDGGDVADLLDNQGASVNTSATPSLSLTTGVPGTMILALCVAASGAAGNPSPGASYTAMGANDPGVYSEGEYDLDAGTAGSKTVDFSLAVSAGYILVAASFNPADGGTGISGTVDATEAKDTAAFNAAPPRKQQVTLVDEDGAVLANLSGLHCYGWDVNVPALLASTLPVDYTASGTTDANGVLVFARTNSALIAGNVAFMLVTTSTGSLDQDPPPRSFFRSVQIENV